MTWGTNPLAPASWEPKQKIPCGRCQHAEVWPHQRFCEPCVTQMNSEDNLKARWLPHIEQHFEVEQEVSGIHCSGARLRIDAIIKPRDTTHWKNPSAAFGVEFKSEAKMRAKALSSEGSRWLAQCADYAHCDFDGYGRVYVLLCGGFSPGSIVSGASPTQDLPRLAYHLGVGELKWDRRSGLSIVFAGEQRIWTEAEGAEVAKRHGLERRFGSR